MGNCLVASQGPVLVALNQAQWIPGIRNFRRAKVQFRFHVDDVERVTPQKLMDLCSQFVEEQEDFSHPKVHDMGQPPATRGTFDCWAVTGAGWVDVLRLVIVRADAADGSFILEATNESKCFLPAKVPLAPILAIALAPIITFIPWLDMKKGLDNIVRLQAHLEAGLSLKMSRKVLLYGHSGPKLAINGQLVLKKECPEQEYWRLENGVAREGVEAPLGSSAEGGNADGPAARGSHADDSDNAENPAQMSREGVSTAVPGKGDRADPNDSSGATGIDSTAGAVAISGEASVANDESATLAIAGRDSV